MINSKGKRRSLASLGRHIATRISSCEILIASAILMTVIYLLLTSSSPSHHPEPFMMTYSTSDTLVRQWVNPSIPNDNGYSQWSSTTDETSTPTVLILTPMKDSAKDLQLYFSLFDRLSYPKSLISLGILEGDSSDDTYDRVLAIMESLSSERILRRLTLVQKNFKSGNRALAGSERHGFAIQGRRRSVQAKCRNHLQSIALNDEKMVLWIDSDLKQYPVDLIERMLATNKRVVSADCVQSSGYCYDRNNWRETPRSLTVKNSLPENVLMFEGYPNELQTYRESLCDIEDGIDDDGLVELQGVGGTALMIEADLIREGLFFPTFPFRHAIETEGIAQVANAMNVQVFGMKTLKVFHDLD